MISAFLETHLCRYMNQQEAQALLDVGRVHIVGRDEKIFREGDPAGSMYAILLGFVKILKDDGAVGEEVLAILSAGDIIGEMSVIDTDPRSASAMTASEVTLYELDRRSLIEFMKLHPMTAVKLLWAILETVSLRLRDSNKNYQNLLSKHLEVDDEDKTGFEF